ncbi:MAG TPA: hypothetical protein VNK91_01175 [Burkholderiaceae bacterium]|nr:hypothetical protein [Burkholderiaceae bacterium]
MRLLALAALSSLAVLGASSAPAQSLSARGGTTGFGAELGAGLTPFLGVRGSYAAGSYDYDTTKSDIRYDAKLKPSVGLLTLDVHPFAGSFRLSAGLGLNNTKVDGRADTTSGTITINGQTYNTSDVGTVEGSVRFERTAPYIGIGWGAAAAPGRGLYFTSDLGVIFSRATGSVSGTCAPSLNPLVCAQLQSDLQAEAQKFKQEVEKVKYYPVVTIGVGYRF